MQAGPGHRFAQRRQGFLLCALLCLGLSARSHAADTARLAVAANFAPTAKILIQQHQATTGHQVLLSSASSGLLFAQIHNGAPFDLFLSADQEKPRRLAQQGLALAESQFSYALGSLVFWSADPALREQAEVRLRSGDVTRIALANPRLAPYGAAAWQVIEKLGLDQNPERQWVLGENISQALQFVYSGNVSWGLLARSQLRHLSAEPAEQGWPVPSDWHEPIRQDAILLQQGQDNTAARSFLRYLQSPAGREIIRAAGYSLDPLPPP